MVMVVVKIVTLRCLLQPSYIWDPNASPAYHLQDYYTLRNYINHQKVEQNVLCLLFMGKTAKGDSLVRPRTHYFVSFPVINNCSRSGCSVHT